MTLTTFFGSIASITSFGFFALALIGQFNCTIKGKSYRTHVCVAGALLGVLLLISLIWVDWGIGYGIFYTVAEIVQIFSILKIRKAKAKAEEAKAEIFEAGKTAGKDEAEALLAPQLAAAKAEGKAEGIADAEEKIRDLKVSIAEKEAVIRFYENKFKK